MDVHDLPHREQCHRHNEREDQEINSPHQCNRRGDRLIIWSDIVEGEVDGSDDGRGSLREKGDGCCVPALRLQAGRISNILQSSFEFSTSRHSVTLGAVVWWAENLPRRAGWYGCDERGGRGDPDSLFSRQLRSQHPRNLSQRLLEIRHEVIPGS